MLYLRLAALAAFLTVGIVALWYRGEAISAEAQRDAAQSALEVATAANKSLERTITRINERNEQNDALIASLFDRVNEINDSIAETSVVISELKENNEDVKAYLAATIPDDLKRLLNSQ